MSETANKRTSAGEEEEIKAFLEEIKRLSRAEHDDIYILREESWSPQGHSITWDVQINQFTISDLLGKSETLSEAMNKVRSFYANKYPKARKAVEERMAT